MTNSEARKRHEEAGESVVLSLPEALQLVHKSVTDTLGLLEAVLLSLETPSKQA